MKEVDCQGTEKRWREREREKEDGTGRMFKGFVLAFVKGIYNRHTKRTQLRGFEVPGYVWRCWCLYALISWRVSHPLLHILLL